DELTRQRRARRAGRTAGAARRRGQSLAPFGARVDRVAGAARRRYRTGARAARHAQRRPDRAGRDPAAGERAARRLGRLTRMSPSRVCTLIAALLLGGCSGFFGAPEDPPLPGERVSVLRLDRTLVADPS